MFIQTAYCYFLLTFPLIIKYFEVTYVFSVSIGGNVIFATRRLLRAKVIFQLNDRPVTNHFEVIFVSCSFVNGKHEALASAE